MNTLLMLTQGRLPHAAEELPDHRQAGRLLARLPADVRLLPAVFSPWRKRLIASGLTFSCDRAVSVLSAILAPVDHYDARRRSCSSAGGMIGRELLAGTGHQVSATATYLT